MNILLLRYKNLIDIPKGFISNLAYLFVGFFHVLYMAFAIFHKSTVAECIESNSMGIGIFLTLVITLDGCFDIIIFPIF